MEKIKVKEFYIQGTQLIAVGEDGKEYGFVTNAFLTDHDLQVVELVD